MMAPKVPILFISPNLGGGGAEWALVSIANHIDRCRFQPHLALFQKEGVFLDRLAGDVPVYEIQPHAGSFATRNWTRVRGLLGLYRQIRPALVMSVTWQANAVAVLAKAAGGKPAVVINEQSAPQASLAFDRRRRMLWPLAKNLYRRADLVVVISNGIAGELQATAQVPSSKLRVIHNPVDLERVWKMGSEPLQYRPEGAAVIVSAGRLAAVKNYSLLIRAFSRVRREANAELYLLGEGPERPALEELARRLGVSEHVHFTGFQQNPYAYIAQAGVFALSSNNEGFGNVLVEALALGTPVISTDCPYGPAEILDNGKYGVLVKPGQEEAYAASLLDLIRDPQKRRRLSATGPERAKAFSIERVIGQYQAAFEDLLKR